MEEEDKLSRTLVREPKKPTRKKGVNKTLVIAIAAIAFVLAAVCLISILTWGSKEPLFLFLKIFIIKFYPLN